MFTTRVSYFFKKSHNNLMDIHTLSTQHNAQMKTDIHMLVMNNVMHIKAKDNTKRDKIIPYFQCEP